MVVAGVVLLSLVVWSFCRWFLVVAVVLSLFLFVWLICDIVIVVFCSRCLVLVFVVLEVVLVVCLPKDSTK